MSATGLAGAPMTFSAMGQVGAAANLAINAGNNQSGIAGSALALQDVSDCGTRSAGIVPCCRSTVPFGS